MGFSGMLWFDHSDQSIIEKVRGAIRGHVRRFERMPQMCLLNKNQFDQLQVNQVDGVPVRVFSLCLEGCFIPGFDGFQQGNNNHDPAMSGM